MITLPDFKEKQILFIIPQKGGENKLRFSNDNVQLLVNGKPVNQISVYKLLSIFVIGDFSLTTVFVKKCMEFGVSIFLLKTNFDVYGSIGCAAEGNYLLRMKQYNLKNEFEIAKNLVKNKIFNQFVLLYKSKKIKKYVSNYKIAALEIDKCKDEKSLLGIEGNYTRKFFQKFFEDMGWYRRLPRAKVDSTNFLMDIGYTFLFNFVDCILRLFGFDTYKGVYHKLFFQRKSLACDIMEPFRCLIDKEILKAFNLKQINEKEFKVKNGKVDLDYSQKKKYLKLFSECVMANKESIYCYIRDYYYCVLNDKNDFPFFKLK
ncbi:MAG: CRISPR-associated endonuclease Cas1 [Candidatus Peregrinibacteria bacterium GW2011_GWA2_33_10]|nr:MAG: CRISPR-associated endonuclease Cas1 [Candidatus Peregrinibacteria bacterium GW2011_GWA2_33_10]